MSNIKLSIKKEYKSSASSYLTKKASDERIAAMRLRIAKEITNSCSSGDFWKLPLSEQRAVVQLALNNL
jgi:hypothetical protein